MVCCVILVLKEPAETIWGLVNAVLMCQSASNFNNFVVIFNITLMETES